MSVSNRMYIDTRMPKSKAFLALKNASSIQILMIFFTKRRSAKNPPSQRAKHGKYRFTNLNELEFTYLEAKRYGFTSARFKRGIDELLDKGFLEIVDTGMGLHKVKTIYELSERWLKYGTPEFKKPKRPQPMQYNMGFQKGNDLWKRRKKKTTVTDNHGAMHTNEHGGEQCSILTMRTNEHGHKVTNCYKRRNGKYLSFKIA